MKVGLTGTLNAGKGEVGRILAEQGFHIFGFGNEVRKEATVREIPHEREKLQKLGAKLRVEKGNYVWCERILAQMAYGLDYVIDGVRYPEDDSFFRQIGDYILISVDAPLELRYQRAILRGREGDSKKTFEQFKLENDSDLGLFGETYGQNALECMKLADYTVINDGTREKLKSVVLDILNKAKRNIK